MREIKFRSWVIKDEKMLTGRQAMAIKRFTPNYGYLDREVVVMQYTGIKDTSGQEIYEGDIVKRLGTIGKVTWECEYRALGFYLNSNEQLMDVINPYSSWALEVIGNIYENPELL